MVNFSQVLAMVHLGFKMIVALDLQFTQQLKYQRQGI